MLRHGLKSFVEALLLSFQLLCTLKFQGHLARTQELQICLDLYATGYVEDGGEEIKSVFALRPSLN